jgi:sulfur relay (sulfurtransferase) DsrF/TusC family protein
MMKVMFLSKLRFLQAPHGVTSQETAISILLAMETSNLTIAFLVQ